VCEMYDLLGRKLKGLVSILNVLLQTNLDSRTKTRTAVCVPNRFCYCELTELEILVNGLTYMEVGNSDASGLDGPNLR